MKHHANIWGADLMGGNKKTDFMADLQAHHQTHFSGVVDNINKLQKSDIKKKDFNFAELLGDINFVNEKSDDQEPEQNQPRNSQKSLKKAQNELIDEQTLNSIFQPQTNESELKAQIMNTEFAKSLPSSPIEAITSPHGNSQGTSNSYTVISESKNLSDQMSPAKPNSTEAKTFEILSREETKSAEKDPL